jgi:hypothetical protein
VGPGVMQSPHSTGQRGLKISLEQRLSFVNWEHVGLGFGS